MSLLHYQYQPLAFADSRPTLVFLHGLFGDLNNLASIAKFFSQEYSILRLDLRNHGQSFHSDEMNYVLMAEDVKAVLEHLHIDKVIVIGHSMGGKTAMTLASLYPEKVEKLIALDIAPVSYQHRWHDDVFQGLFAVKEQNAQTRQQARIILQQYIDEQDIVEFMVKSFDQSAVSKFRFFTTALFNHYAELMGWQSQFSAVPTLFIKAANSDYILQKYQAEIIRQFPQSKGVIIAGAGHWVHAQKPEQVVRAIQRFL